MSNQAGNGGSQPPSPESQPTEQTATQFPVQNWERYELQEILGKGGMGVVYKAWDPVLHRHVAIKFIQKESPDYNKRLLIEARAQARIEHDFICKVFEAGEVQGKLYIAMQLIQGAPLNEIQKELTIEEKVQLMKKTAEAIHAAHESSVIHRDIKPANIMAHKTGRNEWRPCIMDFGLAREIQTDGLTTTGIVMGTPCYIAPEQVKGNQIDSRTDVYGLGATLYELLTGRPPFQGKNPVEILYKVVHEDPPRPSTLNPFVSEKLERTVMKCLRKDPAQRYASAQSLANALKELLESGDVTAAPKNQVRKKILIAVAIALFAIMGGVFLIREKKDFGFATKVEENRKAGSQSQQKPPAKQKLATISMSSANNITLHFDDYDIKDLFKAMGSTTGYNIILDPEVSGRISISIQDVPIHDALKIICKRHNLGYTIVSKNIRVAPISKLRQEEADNQFRPQVEPIISKDDPLNERLSIDFKEINLVDLFRFIADVTGYDVVVDPEIKGKATFKVTETRIEDTLKMVCEEHNLKYTIQGKVIHISKKSAKP